MAATKSPDRRSRTLRLVATGAATSVGLAAFAFAAASPASADTPLYGQSVGRFLDGAAGGQPLESVVNLKDARAQAPNNPSERNPLDAKVLGQADIPLSHKLQIPGGGVFHLGAVNQVAEAHSNGAAFGASGAVSNSGGISSGGQKGHPANATITLKQPNSGSVSIPGLPKLPGAPKLPGGKQPALGSVKAEIGAISGVARTKVGGSFATPRYKIANLNLVLKSPALASLLKRLDSGRAQVQAVLDQLTNKLPVPLPASCTYTPGDKVPSTLTLDHGAVVIDSATGSVTVKLGALLRTLGARLNALPPNTDLLAYVLNNLGAILSKGLANVVNGIINPITAFNSGCVTDLQKIPGLGPIIKKLITQLGSGQGSIEAAIQSIAKQLSAAGGSGLTQLANALSQALDIGVNVQQGAFPLGSEPQPKYRFTSGLGATPDQATPVVVGQGVERAIEIKLGGTQGGSVALGNAAAGPSTSVAPAPTTSTPSAVSTVLPTGVPAGNAAGPSGGGPVPMPLIVLVVVLAAAGGGTLLFRSRGRFSR
jgi:hypothetical protein